MIFFFFFFFFWITLSPFFFPPRSESVHVPEGLLPAMSFCVSVGGLTLVVQRFFFSEDGS